jgi:hypothetical protein
MVLYLVVTSVTAALNAFFAAADLARARFVLETSSSVGVPASWLPMLGALKGAGALGLLAGMLGFRWVGVAAATGLVCFFVGAMVAHVRARQIATIVFPAAMCLLAGASLALAMVRIET